MPTINRTLRALPPSFPPVRWAVAAALLAVVSASCEVHDPLGPGDLMSITVTPDVTLPILGTQQFVAVGVDADGREVSFSPTWTVEEGGGTIDGAGMFTAGTTLGVYTATIRATSGGVFGSATVTVIAGPLATIAVSPNPDTLAITESQQFTATGMDAGGNPVPISPTWSVVSGGGTVTSDSGMFTAGTVAGTFTNSVRATVGSLSGAATVTVIAGAAVSISVTPNPQSLPINGAQQFTATAVDAGGNPVAVTPVWSVEAGGGTINAGTGMFTAGTTLGTFTNTVRATVGSLSGSATVTVVAGPAVSIRVVPDPATMLVGTTQQFTATAIDAGGNSVPITATWSVEAGGGTINASNGLFTAGTTAGTFRKTIKATSGSLSGFATVILTPAAPPPPPPPTAVSITVTPNPATVQINGTQQFTARAVDAAGNNVAITATWSVEEGGGTISAITGLFTAGTTVGTFERTVKATSGGLSGFATVIVTAEPPPPPPTVDYIVVTPDPATVQTNGTQQFTAWAVDTEGDSVAIAADWFITAGGGTIDFATGMFTAGTTAGTFEKTVRANSGDLSGFATVIVTTMPPPPTAVSITVSPDTATMAPEGTQQFTATAEDAAGNPVVITPIWSVEEGGGTIDSATGLFTAGTTAGTFGNTVMATSGSLSGFATVIVTAAPPPPPPPGVLGSAAPNGIMAGTEVTCVSLGTINADVSIHPGSTITGFPPCVITGVQNLGNAIAEQAQIDLATAYNTMAGLACGTQIVADLGGTTLPAGVYCTASSIGVTGTLTLDGGGDPNAEFVFQAGSSLTTAGNIVLINDAQAKNVYWQVGSSATLGTASQWQGNILALTSITLVDNANLIGRALARNGAVTLGTNNTITIP
ncbi:MAG: ice-binding family protein [Gemmatimonadota bacterium]